MRRKMFTLAHPLHLAALLPLAALPYLMRRAWAPKRSLNFAAMALARRAQAAHAARGTRPPPRPLLLARLVALALLVVALSRPEAPVAPVAPQRLEQALFVLDTSPSMAYVVAGKSLFERARQAIAAEAARGHFAGGVGLICTDASCPLRLPLGSSVQELKERLALACPLTPADDLPRTLERAQQALSERGMAAETAVIVASDVRTPAWPLAQAAPGIKTLSFLELVDNAWAETTWPNVSVLGAALRPDGDSQAVSVVATFYNWGAELRRQIPVRVLVDGEVVLRDALDVPPQARTEHTFDVTLERTRAHEFAIELDAHDDGFAADNRAHLLVAPQAPLRIVAINGEPSESRDNDELYFFAEALRQHLAQTRPLPLTQLGPTQLGAALSGDDGLAPDVLVLANLAELKDAELARIVELHQAGMGLLVTSGAQMGLDAGAQRFETLLGAELRAIEAAPCATAGDMDAPHDANAAFQMRLGAASWAEDAEGPEVVRSLAATRTQKRLAVAAPPGRFVSALEFGDGAPALWLGERGRGRVALLTTSLDLAWSDFAISSAFVPLTQALVRWLARAETKSVEPLGVGQALTIPKAGLAAVRLVGPSGEEVVGRSEGARLRLGPLSQAGVWHGEVKLYAGGPYVAASHLDTVVGVDARESDFSPAAVPREILRSSSRPQVDATIGAERTSPRWPACVALLSAAGVWLLVLEAWLAGASRPFGHQAF